MYYLVLTLLIIVALLLILLILIQKGRGGGLSSAFGGGGGSAAFGAKTGDVLTWLTSGFFAAFIILAVTLDLIVNSNYGLTQSKAAAVIPAAIQSSSPGTQSNGNNTTQDAGSDKQVNTPSQTTGHPPATTAASGGAIDQKLNQIGAAVGSVINTTTQKAASATQPK